MIEDIIWIAGDKRKGLSIKKLNYKKPLWRVGIWRGGRMHRTEEFMTQQEALQEALSRKQKDQGE